LGKSQKFFSWNFGTSVVSKNKGVSFPHRRGGYDATPYVGMVWVQYPYIKVSRLTRNETVETE